MSENVKEIIKERRQQLGLTMKEVAEAVGVSEATVSRWESGDIENMRRDKIAKLAEALKISPAVLMGWEDNGTQSDVPYYLDEETAEIAQEVYDRPELKILFDASRKASKEDIQFVVEMIDRMAKKERGED